MIDLLHSSQYISNINQNLSFDTKSKMIINHKKEKLLGISNIPTCKKIYNIEIVKIKQRKSIKKMKNKSKNIFINNYFNKVNINIIVKINYDELLNSIKNKIFPNKLEFFKLLRRNIKPNISIEENTINLVKKVNYFYEYSWYLERENTYKTIEYLPSNIYKTKNIYFNVFNEKYYLTKKNLYINFSLLGGIILSDVSFNYTNFQMLFNKNKCKTLIISNYISNWKSHFNNFNNITYIATKDIEYCNKFYDRIIYDDCISDKGLNVCYLKKFNAKKKWYIVRNTWDSKFEDLVYIYDLLFSYNLTVYDRDLLSLTNNFFIRHDKKCNLSFNKIKIKLNDFEKNFYLKYCNNNDKQLYFSLPLNKINIRYKKNNKLENKSYDCSICLSNIKKNDIAITSCNHYFCYSCIFKYLSCNDKCPLCRNKINLSNTYKLINNNIKNNLPSKLNYILELVNKNEKILLLSKFKKSIDNIENFFKDLNIEYSKIKNCKKKNIILSLYDDLYENNIDNRKVILLEPLLENDNYYKSLLHSQLNHVIPNVLISKNTFEDFS